MDIVAYLNVSYRVAQRCTLDPLRPTPANLTKVQVHDFAERVAQSLEFRPGDPMEPVLARLGGRLSLRNPFAIGDEVAESIRVEPQGTFTIFVSSITSAERDRFTIAHELGHYFLHFPLIRKKHPGQVMIATRWVDETDNDQRRAEWEANWFAAGFLMPQAAFVQTFIKRGGNIKSVASFFGVSPQAAEVRAKTLQLIAG